LLAFVTDAAPGDLIEYDAVQKAIGVNMRSLKNRAKLRNAIIRSGREYTAVPTVGYQLAKPDNAMGILSHKLLKIDNSVRRADRAQKVITDQFFDELQEPEQKAVMFLGSVFGAIRVAAENGKKLYGRERPALTAPVNTVVPAP